MVETTLQKAYRFIRRVLVYQEPKQPSRFVLAESPDDEGPPKGRAGRLPAAWQEFNTLLAAARRLAKTMEEARSALAEKDLRQVQELMAQVQILERQQQDLTPIFLAYESGKDNSAERLISASLEENQAILKELYGLPENKDMILRPFEIRGKPSHKALLIYLDGMVDKQLINMTLLYPLMVHSRLEGVADESLLTVLSQEYLPANQTSMATVFRELAEGVNAGDAGLLVDGIGAALIIDTKGYKQRSVERPQIEQTVRGAQVSFSEGLRTNTGLMRSLMQTSDLVTEIFIVGTRIPQKCALLYLRSIASPLLVAEAKRRLQGIAADFVLNVGMLEQYIEDHPTIPLPQMLSTERPDRIAAGLIEGRLAILLDGTPFGHLFPVSLFNFFHSGEDWSLKPLASNFMRLLRWTGTLLTLILPSMYLAISYYHQEAMPTELVLAVAASREKVPFPAFFEILMMEFSFELIREAGLRVPGMLGSTIGIVGAIILGQAAVSANLVSPIMVVIIAITGLASFVIPDYRMAFAIRTLRFAFLLVASTLGLVGIALGLLILTVQLCGMKSFGMPYMAPVSPKTTPHLDVVLRGPVFKRSMRPDELNPKDPTRQPPVARSWLERKPASQEDEP